MRAELVQNTDAATMAALKEKHGKIDLASVDLAVLHEAGSGYYNDTEVEGLSLSTWQEDESAWRFSFTQGIVHISSDIGNYPKMSLEEARTKARAKATQIEAEMAPSTEEERLIYDHALAALKSGDLNARRDVVSGFLRIAQIPVDMEGDLIVKPEHLPPAEALLRSTKEFCAPLSARVHNCLINDGIEIVAQLLVFTDAQLLRVPNFGRKSLAELRAALDDWLAQWAETPVAPSLNAGVAIALQQKIVASLEQQSRMMKDCLSILEKLAERGDTTP
jgi:hypothetical protein